MFVLLEDIYWRLLTFTLQSIFPMHDTVLEVTDLVGVGVTDLVGDRDTTGVIDGVAEFVGVFVGVNERVGVIDFVGVTVGVTEFVWVIDGVTDCVGVIDDVIDGVTEFDGVIVGVGWEVRAEYDERIL
jgi:hypothetical protein